MISMQRTTHLHARRSFSRVCGGALFTVSLSACATTHNAPRSTTISSQTVEVGCGVCIYHMPGLEGCPLAVLIDGTPYLVEGALWPDHDYCDMKCHAIVSGTIEGGKFVAVKFEPQKK